MMKYSHVISAIIASILSLAPKIIAVSFGRHKNKMQKKIDRKKFIIMY